MNGYGKWITREIIKTRAAADDKFLSRALKFVVASTQQIKESRTGTLLKAKLAQLPAVQEALSNDDMLRAAFGLPFTAVRRLAPGVTVSTETLVKAIGDAVKGHPATLVDQRLARYNIYHASMIHSKTPTVVFVREEDGSYVFGAWYIHLLFADLDALRSYLLRFRQSLVLTEREAEELALELVDLPAIARLYRLDYTVESTALFYYDEVARLLGAGVSFELSTLMPDNVEILANHAIVDAENHVSRATILAERLTWDDLYERLSAFPLSMPAMVLEAFSKLSPDEQRAAERRILRRQHSPTSAMHALHLVTRGIPSSARQRLVKRIVKRWLASKEWISDFLLCASWVANELARCRSLESPQEFKKITLSAWSHAHNLFVLLQTYGYSVSDAAKSVKADWRLETGFLIGFALIDVPSFPDRVKPEQMMIAALADALRDCSVQLDEDFRDYIDLSLRVLNDVCAWLPNVFFSCNERPDEVDSYLNGDRAQQLHFLLGDRFRAEDQMMFQDEFLIQVISTLLVGQPEWWVFVAARIQGDTSPASAVRQSLLQAVDIDDSAFELRKTSPVAWALRLATLSHVTTFEDDEVRNRFESLWREACELASGYGNDLAVAGAIVQCIGDMARRASTRSDRIVVVVDRLEKLVGRSNLLTNWVSRIAQAFRDRLPSKDVTPELSRVILLTRASA